MERFSVGINEGIYDFKIFKRTVGATLTIKWFDRLNKYIYDFRDKNNDDSAYKELEKLVSNLKKKRESLFRFCRRQK
jgi:hypothetical protein